MLRSQQEHQLALLLEYAANKYSTWDLSRCKAIAKEFFTIVKEEETEPLIDLYPDAKRFLTDVIDDTSVDLFLRRELQDVIDELNVRGETYE
jgi:hypothetical protein